ncbi:MAG: hypothetical protein KJ732_07255 [Candidatus Margulisbacteria bacterium]|nr:hypothetical protein [Candidatus Margulisiibacteriota bacterium]
MNIWGVMPNNNEAINVKSANKSTTNINYKGPSFAQSISEVARSVNIQVAQGATASELQFTRQKEGLDKPFKFEDAEEEMLDDYIGRIKKMLGELKK